MSKRKAKPTPPDPTTSQMWGGRFSQGPAHIREEINAALGIGMGEVRHTNVEVKYGGPDGVIIDVSETGWVGTSGLD